MKKIVLLLLSCILSIQGLAAQDWMESLEIAKRLARTQDKFILMVWQDASYYPLSVIVRDKNGKDYFVPDMFSTPELDEVLWEYFVPVKVDELMHEDLFKAIDGKRSASYISKFNDDSIKVLDANGNILATSGTFTEVLDLSKFISRYAINTSFLESELANYAHNKDFFSAFYLAEKYIDFSVFFPKRVRNQLLDLSNIYFDEATTLLETYPKKEEVSLLSQRILLTKLKQDLVQGKSRRVLRQLDKMNAKAITNNNKPLVTYLYYTAYRLRNEKDQFAALESEISLVNLKQAQSIVNINR